MNLLMLDTETTGLGPNRRIWEITLGWSTVPPEEWWTVRVNPMVPMEPGATEIHGVTNEMLKDCPLFASAAPHIQEELNLALFVGGHNLKFDLPLIHKQLREEGHKGVPSGIQWVDTLRLFQRLVPHTLEGAVKHYLGREHDGAHGARADTAASMEVLQAMARRHRLPWPSLVYLYDPPPGSWVDVGHYLYRDDEGNTRFAFGKHRDERVRDHPSYAVWMSRQDFPQDTLEAITRALHHETL